VQKRQRWGAHVKGAPDRVDVGWRARATPTPPCRDVFCSRSWGQDSLPGRVCLPAQMMAQAATSESGEWKKSRQFLSPACATTRDGQILHQNGRQHGGEGKCGSVAAAMRPEGVPSNADLRVHTHVHWAPLVGLCTKVLQTA
jgi:hypothetical protein